MGRRRTDRCDDGTRLVAAWPHTALRRDHLARVRQVGEGFRPSRYARRNITDRRPDITRAGRDFRDCNANADDRCLRSRCNALRTCYVRPCIQSRADALANLPDPARWLPRSGDAAMDGNQGVQRRIQRQLSSGNPEEGLHDCQPYVPRAHRGGAHAPARPQARSVERDR